MGIPMSTNYASRLTELLLLCNERHFTFSISDITQPYEISKFETWSLGYK